MTRSRFHLVASSSLLILCSLLMPGVRAEKIPSAFNGKDFAGWIEPTNNIWWKIDSGVLVVTSDEKKSGSTLWTERSYRNFVMECEYKNGPGVIDSGVFVRNDKEQIQIGISGSLKRDLTASPYIAGKGYPVEADLADANLKADDWNKLTIVAKGPQYSVWLNGKLVMNYKSETAIAEGPIGLQLHPNNEMTISFRNIRIAELD